MSGMVRWYIIGTDLSGRHCRVAQVMMPDHFTKDDVLRELHRSADPFYRIVSEVERA